MEKAFVLDGNTKFHFCNINNPILHYAKKILSRDFEKVLGHAINVIYKQEEADIRFIKCRSKQLEVEQFAIEFIEVLEKKQMVFFIADDLAFMYAIIYLSNTYMGIEPFWFWLEQPIKQVAFIKIPVKPFISEKRAIAYRGWFINDEDCIIGWTNVYPPPREVWFHCFEALLRCGGNMILAGTDLPRDGEQNQLATEMGLWITQHHCAPLGGEMFLRAYPGLEPSYSLYPELFNQLWEQGIVENKERKVVWSLGFRGQGDIPFWENDLAYDTPEKRGQLIESIIEKQYLLLKKYVENPVCSVYLYQESMELYQNGYLKFRPEFIKVWSDNGYGKMLNRRHGRWDPRIEALPKKGNQDSNGIYYHVAFHDLEASNHLTMLGMEPAEMYYELSKVKSLGKLDFILVNAANIKQHTIGLEATSEFWNDRLLSSASLVSYCNRYYPDNTEAVYKMIAQYYQCSVKYGPYEDSFIGEEYYHHPVRKIMTHWIKGEFIDLQEPIAPYLKSDILVVQVAQYKSICKEALNHWSKLWDRCQQILNNLKNTEKSRMIGNYVIQIAFHYYGCKGAIYSCVALEYYNERAYLLAFKMLNEAMEAQDTLIGWVEKSEYGIWENFYKADWLTNIKATRYALDAVRKFIRMKDDGPNLFKWHKYYVMPIKERKIYLENTQREVFSDDQLHKLLKETGYNELL